MGSNKKGLFLTLVLDSGLLLLYNECDICDPDSLSKVFLQLSLRMFLISCLTILLICVSSLEARLKFLSENGPMISQLPLIRYM